MANRRGFFYDVPSASWTRLVEDGIPCGMCGRVECTCSEELGYLLPFLERLPLSRFIREPQEPEEAEVRSQDSYPSNSATEAGSDPYSVPEQLTLCCNQAVRDRLGNTVGILPYYYGFNGPGVHRGLCPVCLSPLLGSSGHPLPLPSPHYLGEVILWGGTLLEHDNLTPMRSAIA